LLNGIDDRFILTVEDDSMINAVIINKDNILVNSQTTAENGDIVVAFLNDSVIVRRYFKEDNHYRLQPENDSMKPIFVDHVEILGKVIGVFRWSIH
jgi:repressor LexA